MEIFGIVTEVGTGVNQGWYDVDINVRSNIKNTVRGVSINGTVLKKGQRVNVVQLFYLYQNDEYGFFPADMGFSLVQVENAQEPAIMQLAPHQFLLNYIANKAFNRYNLYAPGTIQSLIEAGGQVVAAKVLNRFNGMIGVRAFADYLDPNYFSVGDGVLLSAFGYPYKQILGWWQTVPKNVIPYNKNPLYILFRDKTTLEFKLTKSYEDGDVSSGVPYDVEETIIEGVTGTYTAGYCTRVNFSDKFLYAIWDNGITYCGLKFDTETKTYNFADDVLYIIGTYNSYLLGIGGNKLLQAAGNNQIFITDWDGSNPIEVTALLPAIGSFFVQDFFMANNVPILNANDSQSHFYNLSNGNVFNAPYTNYQGYDWDENNPDKLNLYFNDGLLGMIRVQIIIDTMTEYYHVSNCPLAGSFNKSGGTPMMGRMVYRNNKYLIDWAKCTNTALQYAYNDNNRGVIGTWPLTDFDYT